MAKTKKANPEVAAIRERWRSRLNEVQPTQFSVTPDELSTVLGERCPPEFEPLKQRLERERPTHFLLTPAQLKTLASDDSTEQQPDSAADVPSEGTDVDDQIQRRAD